MKPVTRKNAVETVTNETLSGRKAQAGQYDKFARDHDKGKTSFAEAIKPRMGKGCQGDCM